MKGIPLLCLLLLGFTILLTGCADGFQTSGHARQYEAEHQDVADKIRQGKAFAAALPKEYDLTASVTLSHGEDADRIVYEIFVRRPKVRMENLRMSFSLNPEMTSRLKTSDVFTSNALNGEPISYAPGSSTNGISLDRGFVLDPSLIDRSMLSIFREMYVKISYSSSDSQVTDYVRLNAEPSADLLTYLNSSPGE
ncbi:hypothetical protein KIH86_21000 [Paenibacillus sp. HN-1]|uniref:hypothetical protein n=1 Tax=Paenibacillus TaxID=44249 RepID=UPI001CA8E04B|nr:MULTISPECIES: hypothetical protein [Paenibacillus]MBY9079988.1 hypothetical protein [Paenibacillus sp. CGMCC 1.18879]MBY9086686.1 hypothetical protein [Paenibacillus sinensis]